MKKKLLLLIFFFAFLQLSLCAICTSLPNKLVGGMKHNKIQLIVHGDHAGLSNEKVSINYPALQLQAHINFRQ
jgi:hypothetical protein